MLTLIGVVLAEVCQFSPGIGPPVFGQDGPLAGMAVAKLQTIEAVDGAGWSGYGRRFDRHLLLWTVRPVGSEAGTGDEHEAKLAARTGPLVQPLDQAGARHQVGPDGGHRVWSSGAERPALRRGGGVVISRSLATLIGRLIREIADSDIVILSRFALPRNGIFPGGEKAVVPGLSPARSWCRVYLPAIHGDRRGKLSACSGVRKLFLYRLATALMSVYTKNAKKAVS